MQPDLVIGFCDMQADICRDLVNAGIEVHQFNQRTVDGILRMIAVLAALVRREEAGQALIASLRANIATARDRAAAWTRKPVIYFEEWNEPLMSGIGWAAELIEIAGGADAFPELSTQPGAEETHHRRSFGGSRARTRHHHRQLVRQEIPAGATGGTRWLGCYSRSTQWHALRNQVA